MNASVKVWQHILLCCVLCILVHSQARLWFYTGYVVCFIHFFFLCLITWSYTCVWTQLRMFGFDVSVIISINVSHSMRLLNMLYFSSLSTQLNCGFWRESNGSGLRRQKEPKFRDAADLLFCPGRIICFLQQRSTLVPESLLDYR